MLRMRILANHEIEVVKSFYQESGYSQLLDPTDAFLIAEEGDEIRAALRLCLEDGTLVLRGMRVHPRFLREGIGSELLRFACEVIGDEVCYCISHRYLRGFYGQIGFREISSDSAPGFLASRLEQYQRDHRLDVILMQTLA